MLLSKEEKERGGMIVIWRDDFNKLTADIALEPGETKDDFWFQFKRVFDDKDKLNNVIDLVINDPVLGF